VRPGTCEQRKDIINKNPTTTSNQQLQTKYESQLFPRGWYLLEGLTEESAKGIATTLLGHALTEHSSY
jgi:hypothetical protein